MKRSTVVVFFASWVVLTFVLLENPFGAGSPEFRFEDFQLDSEALVVHALERTERGGALATGGFLVRDDGSLYLSQAGWQGRWWSAARALTNTTTEEFLPFAHFGQALASALVLAGIVAAAAELFGPGVALALLAAFAISDWLVFMGRNLYWAMHLLLAPFLASLWLYPRWQRGAIRGSVYFGVIAVLVFLKSACGYEYLSNVIAAAWVPAFFHDSPRNPRLWRACVCIALAGVIGFAAAVGVHVAQAAAFFGSPRIAVQALRARAESRVIGTTNSSRLYTPVPEHLPPLPHFGYFMGQNAMSVRVPRGPSISIGSVLAIALFSAAIAMLWQGATAASRALAPALLAALAAAFSWHILGRPHMYYHRHLNQIIYYVPALPVAYLQIASLVRDWIRSYASRARSRCSSRAA